MIEVSSVHGPSDACAEVHCWSHDVDEPIPAGAKPYLVCLECNHVYRTAGDLRAAYRRGVREFDRWWLSPFWLLRLVTIRAGQVQFCPHCIHDF